MPFQAIGIGCYVGRRPAGIWLASGWVFGQLVRLVESIVGGLGSGRSVWLGGGDSGLGKLGRVVVCWRLAGWLLVRGLVLHRMWACLVFRSKRTHN